MSCLMNQVIKSPLLSYCHPDTCKAAITKWQLSIQPTSQHRGNRTRWTNLSYKVTEQAQGQSHWPKSMSTTIPWLNCILTVCHWGSLWRKWTKLSYKSRPLVPALRGRGRWSASSRPVTTTQWGPVSRHSTNSAVSASQWLSTSLPVL